MPKKRMSAEQIVVLLRLMTLIDEFTRECLAIWVTRRINGLGVLETMAKVMMVSGVPEHVRSDNGPEMTSKVVQNWLAKVGAQTLYIELAGRGRTLAFRWID